jgi:hypothetical protein
MSGLLAGILAATTLFGLVGAAYATGEVEPNNDYNTATAVAINAVHTGNFAKDSEYSSYSEDYYKFVITSAGPYTIEFYHSVPSGAPATDFSSMTLHDAYETYVASAYPKLNVATTYISKDWLNAGTYYVEMAAYSGSDAGYGQNYSFKILRGAHIDSLSVYDAVHTGKVITPSHYVYAGAGSLKVGTDYTVSGASKAVGVHKLTVTGKGNYYGTLSANYTIRPDTAWISTVKSKAQKGKKIKIAWSKVTGVTKYVIHWKVAGGKWKTKEVAASKSSYTFKKLKAKKKYSFYLTDYAKVGSVKYQGAFNDSAKKYNTVSFKAKK